MKVLLIITYILKNNKMNYIERIKDLKRKRLKAEAMYAIGMICELDKNVKIQEDTLLNLTMGELIDVLQIVLDTYHFE